MTKTLSGADVTRNILLSTAIRLFGEKGYDAVSTRDIADAAAANIGSIAYHFGGKPGLRKACAESVITCVSDIIGPTFDHPLPSMSPDDAAETIRRMVRVLCTFWFSDRDSQMSVHFVLREMMEGGEIAEYLFAHWLKPMHRRLCALFGLATGLDAESETVRLAVFSIVGQIFHFRVGQKLIMRRMEWDELGPDEVEKVIGNFEISIGALIGAHRRLS